MTTEHIVAVSVNAPSTVLNTLSDISETSAVASNEAMIEESTVQIDMLLDDDNMYQHLNSKQNLLDLNSSYLPQKTLCQSSQLHPSVTTVTLSILLPTSNVMNTVTARWRCGRYCE